MSAGLQTRHCIDSLNTVLRDESRGPAPHPCLAYASTSQIYITITKLTLSAHDDDLLRAAATFFNTLIDAELDGAIDNRLFARALVDLVRWADPEAEDVESRLIELLFGIANNIRLQPSILPAWFAPRTPNSDEDYTSDSETQQHAGGKEFAGATRRDDFPLFYLLLDNVHDEGRAGDFARTGLLYLIETASRSKILEKWLIESDLATLMATGLGALYSQLGSLSFEPFDEDVPEIITFSDQGRQETAVQPRLGKAMDSFLSYLLFWQDTIDHCKSAEVNATLLDHFHVLFLQQLLYPSLLESSDLEGGSTSAVLTYLYRILESIDHPDLVHRILHFLLASPTDNAESLVESQVNPNMSLSRRKSLDVLTAFAQEAAKPSPSFFNLRDLVLMGLHSSNCQTVLATLRLLTVILQRHQSFAHALVRTIPTLPTEKRTIGAWNAELREFLTLAVAITEDHSLNESYDSYLKDATIILEARLNNLSFSLDGMDYEPLDFPMELRKSDPIFVEILRHLGHFFANSVVVNLALTEVIISLASSPRICLDGWLLVDQLKYQPPTEDSDPGTKFLVQGIQRAFAEPIWSSTDTSPLVATLQKLTFKIQQWRQKVSDFDVLVTARRAVLHQNDRLSRSRQPSDDPSVSSNDVTRVRIDRLESGTDSPRGRHAHRPDTLDDSLSPYRHGVESSRDPSLRPLQSSRGSSTLRTAAAEELRSRLAMPFYADHDSQAVCGRETVVPDHEATESEEQRTDREIPQARSATLSHVLTNVVILYEFLLELAATIQVRADLFDEVRYQTL